VLGLVHTIGHSNRTLEEFLSLLRQHELTAVADVRSWPHSRTNPQFNREPLAKSLKEEGISYVFLGRELGARTTDAACYVAGKVQYDKLARSGSFQEGLRRVETGSQNFRVALMCAEKEPLACHRSILIARYLVKRGFQVKHIIDSSAVEDHQASIDRLLSLLQMSEIRMFARDELIELAYERQGENIAFTSSDTEKAETRESA
jgi:uncharacterized protein (DUF488 family)